MSGVKEIKPEGFGAESDKPKSGIKQLRSDLPRKRTVTPVTGESYVLYEISYEKDMHFSPELDKNTVNPKLTLSKLKWIWLYNFKGKGIGGWTGAKEKPYAEATGQKDIYNIGTNYILSQYATLGAKKIKAGKSFWLEAFSLFPEFKSPVGCFVVMLAAQPVILEINAEKPLSKCGCDIDKPTEYRYGELLAIKLLLHEIRDNHTVIVEVKSSDGKVLSKNIVKNFVPDKTDDTNNFIGVYYNFTAEVNVIVDNKWKELLSHQPGQTKEIIVHVSVWDHMETGSIVDRTITSVKTMVSTTAVNVQKPIAKELSKLDSTKLTLFYDTDEVAQSRQQQTAQVVKIGTSLVKTTCYDPCKYESITIEETESGAREKNVKENKEAEDKAVKEKAKKGSKAKPAETKELDSRKFVMLSEAAENGKKVLKDYTYMTYNLVSGPNKGQRELLITLGELNVDDSVCHNNPKHKGKVFDTSKIEEAIQIDKEAPKTDSAFMQIFNDRKNTTNANGISLTGKNSTKDAKPAIVQSPGNTDDHFKFKVAYQYGDMSIFKIFSYFLPQKVKPNLYTILASTCRYQRPITIAVYPDIKWTLNIKYNFEKAGWFESKKWNQETKYEMKSLAMEQQTIDISSPDFHIRGVQTTLKAEIQHNEKSKLKRVEVKEKDPSQPKPGLLKKTGNILQDLELGLEAQWDGGDQKEEVTDEFLKEVYQEFKVAFEVYRQIVKIIKGTTTPSEPATDAQTNFMQDFIKGFKKNRTKLSFELTPPSVAASLAWYLSAENNSKDPSLNNLNTLTYDFGFDFSPIFGANIKLDFLAMVQNAHPIAYVVVKLIDIAATLGGADIIADLKLSGDINLKGEGTLDMMTGANTLTNRRYQKDTQSKMLDGNVKVELTLTLKFTQNKSYNLLVYKVIVSGEISAEAKTFFTIGGTAMADDKGLYISWDFKFGGLKVIVTAKIKVSHEGSRANRRSSEPEKEKELFKAGDKYEFILLKESTVWTMGRTNFYKETAVDSTKIVK